MVGQMLIMLMLLAVIAVAAYTAEMPDKDEDGQDWAAPELEARMR